MKGSAAAAGSPVAFCTVFEQRITSSTHFHQPLPMYRIMKAHNEPRCMRGTTRRLGDWGVEPARFISLG
jgi:hypothetical protein